jgi:hypothetical protein
MSKTKESQYKTKRGKVWFDESWNKQLIHVGE